MNEGEACLILLCEVAERAAKRRAVEAIASDSNRSPLFDEWKLRDKERDIAERDERIKERDTRIALLTKSQELLVIPLQETEKVKKRNKDLEDRLFELTKQNAQLQERLSKQANEMATACSTRLTQARTRAMDELEVHAKKLYLLLGPLQVGPIATDINECIDQMRMVVAKQLL